jgi:hypothetical protein
MSGRILTELSPSEIDRVSGGISGYEGAGAILTVLGAGAAIAPVGAVVIGIGLGAAIGLAGAQFLANTLYFGGGRRRGGKTTDV